MRPILPTVKEAGVLIIVTIVAIVLGTVDFGLSRIIQWALQG